MRRSLATLFGTRMMFGSLALSGLVLGSLAAVSGVAEARDQIRIVGSSTVYPFATSVAEEFGKTSGFKTPVVESTGSGGGLKLFCSGVGADYVDIANASRRIKASEVARCVKNGVTGIIEVKIGYDGIVLANSRESGRLSISLREIWLALAKDVPGADGAMVANFHTNWNEIAPALPDVRIEVLGPPPTSGTRDAFLELAMEGGCRTFPEIKALKKIDKTAFKKLCHTIREDGAFVEAGENDNLIVQKLEANPRAFGIFGHSFLDQNRDKLQGSIVDDVEPTFDNIAAGDYPVSRSLFFYAKLAHVGVVPGIEEYLAEFTDEETWGDFGYLTDKGLIPLLEEEREEVRDRAMSLTPLDAQEITH
jgi:phosphate transport system substrate-binding protein